MFNYAPQDNLSTLASAAARKAMSRPVSLTPHPVIHLDDVKPKALLRLKRTEPTETSTLKSVETRVVPTKQEPIPFPTTGVTRAQEIMAAWLRAASKIVVVGVGGAGGNAVGRMIDQPTANFDGIRFVVANTDAQALKAVVCDEKLELGPKVTRGLGAGGIADIGMKAAEESITAIQNMIGGADLVFLTLGLGGGSGGGAAPVIAKVAREMGAVVVAVVTLPFMFEGGKRATAAQEALTRLRAHSDTVVVVDNNALLKIFDKKERPTLAYAFSVADQCLQQAVDGMVGIIRHAGYINLDFADVRATLAGGGRGYFGTGSVSGDGAAVKAMEQALGSRLLGDDGLTGAKKVLVYFRGDPDMPAQDIQEAMTALQSHLAPNVETFFGFGPDSEMGDRVEVTLFAVGISGAAQGGSVTAPAPRPTPAQPPVAASQPLGVAAQVALEGVATGSAPAVKIISPVEVAARAWREEVTSRNSANRVSSTPAAATPQDEARQAAISSRDAMPPFLARLEERNGRAGAAQKFEITDDHSDRHHDNLDYPAFLRKRAQRSKR